MRFLHAADIHLGRQFSGLKEIHPDPAHLFRTAGYLAWERLIERAVELRVDFVVLAGDVFESSTPDMRSRVAFREGLERLHESRIHVFAALGNHDPFNVLPRSVVELPGLHVFPTEVEKAHIPGREYTEGLVLFGMSFDRPEVLENLVPRFRRDPGPDLAVGVLHVNVSGLGGHRNYAPCTLGDLLASGMDIWCLGHVHAGRVLHEDPLILYSGATQGSHMGETGIMGCSLITIGESGKTEAEFLPLSPVTWEERVVDCSGVGTAEELLPLIECACTRNSASDEPTQAMVIRVRLLGNPAMDISPGVVEEAADLLKDRLMALSVPVLLESLIDGTRPRINRRALMADEGFLGEFLRTAATVRDDERILNEFTRTMSGELSGKISPRFLNNGSGHAPGLADPSTLSSCLDDAVELVTRLFAGEPNLTRDRTTPANVD